MSAAPESVLVPSTRMPRALALIRAFGEAGSRVYTCDTAEHFREPGSHSRYVEEFLTVPPPASEPTAYVEAVADAVRAHDIALVVPQFEEILYLSQAADLLGAPLLAAPFETLLELHDKRRFQSLCDRLGRPVPRTSIATSNDELVAAVADFEEYVARPAYSRGGLVYLTNVGPRADERSLAESNPTPENPWLVQEYIDGDDVCSWGVARGGEIVLHVSYRPTVQMETGASIQFTSVEDFGALEHARAIARELELTGEIGLDMRIDSSGRAVLLECNPRCTNGTFLVPREWLVEALAEVPGDLREVPAGRSDQWDLELLAPQFSPLTSGRTIHELLSHPDPTFSLHDIRPGLVAMSNLLHYSVLMLRGGHDLVRDFEGDVVWDGQVVDRAAVAAAR